MNKPLLLDAFCGAGGAAMGYHRSGFEVIGVDIAPQPRYPFEFIQGDALDFIRQYGKAFDAIHASPPCQDHSISRNSTQLSNNTGWMLPVTRGLLMKSGLPWIIENVPGAPMRTDFRLCGCMFDLPRLRRPRLFETSWRESQQTMKCKNHSGTAVSISGTGGMQGREYRAGDPVYGTSERNAAMGIDWMTRKELSQAIPPAFTEYVGRFLMKTLPH